jgi:hypothetical protein
MTSILVSAETETWVTDEGEGSDEPYTWQGATGGAISNVWACMDESGKQRSYGPSAIISFEEDVRPGDTVYAVVACYTTGGTFQREGGQAQIVDVFLNPPDALDLVSALELHGEREYYFTHRAKEYYCPWAGYFETLDKVEVWSIQVRQSPKDPYTDERSPAVRFGR